MSLDASVLPSELLTTAAPLVGLSGLDVPRNAIHKCVWDAFNNAKKPDSESIQYKLLPASYEFPVSKPKHQSYEWYSPKGILKRNWMLKHLHVLPAVVVLFQDLEWNDPQWTEKQLQCAATIQVLKNSLQGRNTRIAIALLQRGQHLAQGDDLLASERAAQLTSNCDINAKMLFVLPHNDHLMGHIFRLQSAFLELAQSYYAQMMKQIRMHREQLTDAHLLLKIRHQFKLAFISELKLDQSNALRHYRQTYTYLDEVRIVDTNCLEVKTIAGFVSYKICRLFFRLNAPKDSISHFKNHVQKYRSRTGFKELLFEHYAWLSVQYSAFGELFCDAVKNGLAPLQTQHPGIYFHKAAEYVGMRKDAFLQCVALANAVLSVELGPSVSNSALYSDFFGIRGTKTGEPVSEQQIICLVQENERSVNHSTEKIALLGKAMAQFKVYKCLRFRKKLAIDMAEEYLKSGDHAKALTLYSLMLTDYRVDKWYTIFTQVLLKTLHSAYLSASVPDFIGCSVEALSPRIAMEKQERILILENLWKVFHNVSPVSSSQNAPELTASWQTALASFSSPIKLDLDRLNDLLECRVTFEKRQIKNDEKLQLRLYVRSMVEVPLKVRNISLLLTDLKSSSVRIAALQYAEYDGREESDNNEHRLKAFEEFILEPDKCYRVVFVGERYLFSESIDVHLFRLELQMGSDRTFAVMSLREKLNNNKHFKSYNPHGDCMERIAIISSCYIIPTFHLSSQTLPTNQPMLTNEFYQVTTSIANHSDLCLQNVGVGISVPQLLRNSVFVTTDLSQPMQKIHSHVQIDIGELQMQSSTTVSYYLTSLVAGNIELRQKMYYQMENLHQSKTVTTGVGPSVPNGIGGGNVAATDSPSTPNSEKEDLAKLLASEKNLQRYVNNHNVKIEYLADEQVRKIKEDTVVIPCVEEIKLTGRFYTLSREALGQAYRNEDFLLRLNMEVKSPDPINILETQFVSDHNIMEKPYKSSALVLGTALRPASRFEELKLLSAINCSRDWVSQEDYQANDTRLVFNRSQTPDHGGPMIGTPHSTGQRSDEQYQKNLLSKLPTNATIIGSTSAQLTSQMNLSLTHASPHAALDASAGTDGPPSAADGDQPMSTAILGKGISVTSTMTTSTGSVEEFKVKPLPLNESITGPSGSKVAGHAPDDGGKSVTKNVYNHGLDSVKLTNNDRNGFINANYGRTEHAGDQWPVFGLYCVRWCRTRTPVVVNESKFIINGIEVVDPPLNLYCYLDQRMYVRTPMTFRITLRNPTRRIVHLQAILNSSDSFMFAGHRQLNVTIFSYSSYDLLFNLCPLKAGWQLLPELQLEYQTFQSPSTLVAPDAGGNPAPAGAQPLPEASLADDDVIPDSGADAQRKAELAALVQRWIPKMVFIHPPTRTL